MSGLCPLPCPHVSTYGQSEYPSNMNCAVTVVAESGAHVTITFASYTLQSQFDFVKVGCRHATAAVCAWV